MKLLEVRKLNKNFGGLKAVSQLDFDVHEGEILGLVGPNGAGKTTVFNLITGIYVPNGGKILFHEEDITGLKSHKIASKGIARTFQLTTLYSNCSALENVVMGHHLKMKTGVWSILWRTPPYWREEKKARQSSLQFLEFIGLCGHEDILAKNLPHGHQQRLKIAIAISSSPKLLLLDEPVSGMNPEETSEMMALISKIRAGGITIIMIEHDMKAVMGLCDRIVVINYGEKLAEGSPQQIKENPEVIEAYLGREDDFA
jgi:branched-chain amino acid transport system ATP-binding protein